jgi:hypothetical protein
MQEIWRTISPPVFFAPSRLCVKSVFKRRPSTAQNAAKQALSAPAAPFAFALFPPPTRIANFPRPAVLLVERRGLGGGFRGPSPINRFSRQDACYGLTPAANWAN